MAAEEKERLATEGAKVNAQSNIGEKKSTNTEEVPVAKCLLELKKEKADAKKSKKEAEEKATTIKLEAAAAEKQAAFEKVEATKEKPAEKEKKENETSAALKETLACE